MIQETAYTRNPLMEGFSEGRFITSDGVSLRYLHAGTGTPLIMVPGWAGTADTFSLNAPDFAQDNEVFVLDMRGHGFSEAPKYGAQVVRLSADLAEFIEWIGAPKVNLIGHSMGCCVLWGYIELFGQDRIEHAVFIDEAPLLTANPEDSDEEVRRYGGNRIDPWTLCNRMRADFDGARKELMAEYFTHGVQGFPEERLAAAPDDYAKLWAMVPPNPPKAAAFLTDLLFNHLVTDWRSTIERIDVPCLLVTGDVSHAITPEAAQWIAETIPGCAWVRFSEEELGDHSMFQRSYKKFNTAVRNFLNGVEAESEPEAEPAAEPEPMIPASATSNIAAVRSRVPAPDSAEPEPEEEEEAPAPEGSERLFDIQKVTIGPRTLLARVRVGEGHPLFTSEDPEATDRILELLPDLANHICVGDVAPHFGDVIGNTEVAHLLEHVAVEIMARTELGGDISNGRTRSLAEDPRLFEIELDCPDDVLTAGALSSAAWILDWSFSGAEDPVPDVEGIVEGLRSMIFDLSGESADDYAYEEDVAYDGDAAYDDDAEYPYGEEAEIIDFAGVTGSVDRLPQQLGATGVVDYGAGAEDSGNDAQGSASDPDATIVAPPVDDE